jgi:spore coat polysaccharide biosynthesis protein SpsF (cytidylyltransferase family)
VLTSAINYNDYLKIFKKHNYDYFDEIYVATDTKEDKKLQEICNDSKFRLIKTDKFYIIK